MIEIDDVYCGGECCGDASERGSPNKTPLVAGVATHPERHRTGLHTTVVGGFRKSKVVAWAKFIDANSTVVFDGLMSLCAITAAGIEHEPLINGGGPASVEVCDLAWVNTAIGNINKALHGTYHPASAKDPRNCTAIVPSSPQMTGQMRNVQTHKEMGRPGGI